MRNSRVDPKLAHRHFKRVNTVNKTIKRMHMHWGKRTQSLPGDPNEEAVRQRIREEIYRAASAGEAEAFETQASAEGSSRAYPGSKKSS